MLRAFGQSGRTGPAALLRIRSDEDRGADHTDLAVLAVDLDCVRAFVGGPRQEDAARAGGCLQCESRRVFERLVVEAARFEPRRNAAGSAGPARDAIKRMPAVIGEDA